MTVYKCSLIAWLFFAVAAFLGCSVVVGDFKEATCSKDVPKTCKDIGDVEAQRLGCCNQDATVLYFCKSDVVVAEDCKAKDFTCDYSPDDDAMWCVE